MEFWILGLIFMVGVTIGVIFSKWWSKAPTALGTIVVDRSDPDDGPYMFLEIEHRENVGKIMEQKQVVLNVEHKNYLSR